MLNIVKKSAKVLKNNLIFIQPLLLCMLLFMTVASFFISKNVFIAGKICLSISIFLLTIAFTAGWLHINKLGILSYNENDSVNADIISCYYDEGKVVASIKYSYICCCGVWH